MLELLVKFFTVLALGAAELWAAVPAGFALGLGPVLTGIAAAAGAMLGATAVAVLGERLRNWVAKWHGSNGRVNKIWSRYGVIGLGLLAPFSVGAPIGTALGIALGAPAKRLLLWIGMGITLCSAGLVLALYLGMEALA